MIYGAYKNIITKTITKANQPALDNQVKGSATIVGDLWIPSIMSDVFVQKVSD